MAALLEVHSGAWLRGICWPGDFEVDDREEEEAMNRGVWGVGTGAELEKVAALVGGTVAAKLKKACGVVVDLVEDFVEMIVALEVFSRRSDLGVKRLFKRPSARR